jgi:hypothetical protein
MWNPVSVCSEIVLVLVKDRCTVCTKHTLGSEIILDTPNLLLGDQAQVEAQLISFGDNANLEAR